MVSQSVTLNIFCILWTEDQTSKLRNTYTGLKPKPHESNPYYYTVFNKVWF